jgi:hypothetical protein
MKDNDERKSSNWIYSIYVGTPYIHCVKEELVSDKKMYKTKVIISGKEVVSYTKKGVG